MSPSNDANDRNPQGGEAPPPGATADQHGPAPTVPNPQTDGWVTPGDSTGPYQSYAAQQATHQQPQMPPAPQAPQQPPPPGPHQSYPQAPGSPVGAPSFAAPTPQQPSPPDGTFMSPPPPQSSSNKTALFIALGLGAVLLCVILGIVGLVFMKVRTSPDPDPQPTSFASSTTDSSSSTSPSSTQPSITSRPSRPNEPTTLDEAFGTFEPIVLEGNGSKVVELKAPIQTAAVQVETNESLINIKGLNANNKRLDTISNYVGRDLTATGTYLLRTYSYPEPEKVTKLQIEMKGAWKITLLPVSQTDEIPENGFKTKAGAYVVRYNGPAKTWQVQTDSERGGQVTQYTLNGAPGGYIIESEPFDKQLALEAGPSVFVIETRGELLMAPID